MADDQQKQWPEQLFNRYRAEKQARRYLWLGVGVCAAILIALWIYALVIRITFVDWKKDQDRGLWGRAGDTWNKVFSSDSATATLK